MKLRLFCGFSAVVLALALAPLGARGQGSSEAQEATAFARAQEAEKSGDFRTAEQIYEKVLRKHSGLLAAETNLGLVYYLDHRYADSKTYLLKVLEAKPDLFPALMIVGVDFMKLGEPQRAVPLLRRARELNPANEYVNHNLAGAEYLAGDYVDACADYIRYLRFPERTRDVPSWYGFGEASLVLGKEAATATLGRLPPSNPYRLRYLITLYSGQQEWSLALSRLAELEKQPAWKNWARLQSAEIALHQGQLAQAAAEFRRVLSEEPEAARAHFGLGISLLLEGSTEAALPELAAAARNPWLFADPQSIKAEVAKHKVQSQVPKDLKNGSTLVNSFVAIALQGAQTLGEERGFHQALEGAIRVAHQENESRLAKALPGAPSPQKLIKLAQYFLDQGDAEAAADTLSHLRAGTAAGVRPILQARIKDAEGDALETVEALLPLLKAQSAERSPEVTWWISILFERAAELALQQVVTIAPNSAYSHLLKAQVDDAHSQTEAAIHELRLAVQSAPDDPSTYFRLGEELWQAGHFEDAISTLLEGLKLDPHNAPADYQIGDSYLSLAQPERALPFLTAALKEDPDLAAAYKDLGTIYLNEEKYQQAVAVLGRAVPRDANGSVHYLLFRAYSRLGDKAKAAACLKRFQELKAAAQNQVLFDAQAAQQGTKGAAKDN